MQNRKNQNKTKTISVQSLQETHVDQIKRVELQYNNSKEHQRWPYNKRTQPRTTMNGKPATRQSSRLAALNQTKQETEGWTTVKRSKKHETPRRTSTRSTTLADNNSGCNKVQGRLSSSGRGRTGRGRGRTTGRHTGRSSALVKGGRGGETLRKTVTPPPRKSPWDSGKEKETDNKKNDTKEKETPATNSIETATKSSKSIQHHKK